MAEDRFKNLTPLQWMFHYKEIQKYRKVDIDRQTDILEVILDRLELLVVAVNPELGGKLLKLKEDSTITTKGTENNIIPADLTGDNFMEAFNKLQDIIPMSLEVDPNTFAKKSNLTKISREELLKRIGIHTDIKG